MNTDAFAKSIYNASYTAAKPHWQSIKVTCPTDDDEVISLIDETIDAARSAAANMMASLGIIELLTKEDYVTTYRYMVNGYEDAYEDIFGGEST